MNTLQALPKNHNTACRSADKASYASAKGDLKRSVKGRKEGLQEQDWELDGKQHITNH